MILGIGMLIIFKFFICFLNNWFLFFVVLYKKVICIKIIFFFLFFIKLSCIFCMLVDNIFFFLIIGFIFWVCILFLKLFRRFFERIFFILFEFFLVSCLDIIYKVCFVFCRNLCLLNLWLIKDLRNYRLIVFESYLKGFCVIVILVVLILFWLLFWFLLE